MNDRGNQTELNPDDLILRVLHGAATADEGRALAAKMEHNRELQVRFSELAMLSDMLREEAASGGFAENITSFFSGIESASENTQKPRKRMWWWVPAAAAIIVGLCSLMLFLAPANASASLERLIERFGRPTDLSYVMHVLDEGMDRPGGRPEAAPDRGRFPPSAYLDGARLYLRGSNGFVLEQSLPGDVTRTLGSDGCISWSLRDDGPVRVSRDPQRFGGGLWSGKHRMPFLEIRAQLDELRNFYQVSRFDPPAVSTGSRLEGLKGERLDSAKGGPKQIEIWYDPQSCLIHRLILRGLPKGGAGPESLSLDLSSSAPLDPGFFHHSYHHAPDRVVEEEPSTGNH